MMELSEKQYRILSCVHLQADTTIASIARQCGYKEHTVRHFINGMLQKGIIVKRYLIDTFRLGLHRYSVYLALDTVEQHKVIEGLVNADVVEFVGELGGDWNCCFTALGKSGNEVIDLLSQLGDEDAGFSSASSYGEILGLTMYSMGSNGTEGFETARRCLSFSEQPVQIDELDHRILTLLSQDGTLDTRSLARELGAPTSTVQYRLERLKDSGVIRGTVYRIFTSKLGYHTFLIHASANYQRQALWEQVQEFSASEREVDYVIHRMGAWDFEFGTNVADVRDVVQLSKRIETTFKDSFESISILPVLAFPKVSNYPLSPESFERFWGTVTAVPKTSVNSG